MQQHIAERLKKLRNLMQKCDYYLVPSSDPHKNEYIPECWQRRAWISGFTGSAGDALIGKSKAYLWTDARYYLQAEQQLDASCFELMRSGQTDVPTLAQWLTATGDAITLGVDPKVISLTQARLLQSVLAQCGGELVTIANNLIDDVWQDQATIPQNSLNIFPEIYAGRSVSDKLQQLRDTLKQQRADAHVLNTLDAIAWLFNIRGSDVAYNPLVISYAIITASDATLFVDELKISEEVITQFATLNIKVKAYTQFENALKQLHGTVWIDPNSASYWIAQQLEHTTRFEQPSPVITAKAIKNATEQRGAREAHLLDGVAVVRFLHWLENHWQDGVTEISAADRLEQFRRDNPLCVDLSFPTIAGFGPHGAIIHYSASDSSDITIDDTAPLLIDSGGQYYAGTTDVTRTIHLGEPTDAQRRHYTAVLKGHLALRHAIFPKGRAGIHLDALAHQFLWQQGIDYGHGTGHGVGSYLCVHEGPQGITHLNTYPLQAGMIVSNEPGIYFTGEYGIRIENLCLIQEVYSRNNSKTGHGPFYQLDDLTMIPYCRKLINYEALTAQEIQWINEYHQKVFQRIAPHITDKAVLAWLNLETAVLTPDSAC